MHWAALHGYMEVVEWLHENRKEGCRRDTLKDCVIRGKLDIVKWLYTNKREVSDLDGVIDHAAGFGHLELVRWFHENTNERCTRAAMCRAAGNGHLSVVKWLHEHRREGCTTDAMDTAAMRGHLEVVKWLHANRDEGCTTEAMDGAVRGNHLGLVRWLCRHRSEGCTTSAIKVALQGTMCLETADLLFSRFPECRGFSLRDPVTISRVELVEWLRAHATHSLNGRTLLTSRWNSYVWSGFSCISGELSGRIIGASCGGVEVQP